MQHVELLEQMAVAFYRESFVALRFPGYRLPLPRLYPLRVTLPNGWEVTTLLGSKLTALKIWKARQRAALASFSRQMLQVFGTENINGIGRYESDEREVCSARLLSGHAQRCCT